MHKKNFLKHLIFFLIVFSFASIRSKPVYSYFSVSDDNYIIIEKYQKTDGTSIKSDTSSQLPRSKSYIKDAPYIVNYVPIDAKVDGKSIGNKDVNVTITSSTKEHEVIFIYKDDKNNNGIPDDEENYIIIEKYQKPDGTSLKSDNSINLKLGENYTKKAPDIRNYTPINVKVDGSYTNTKDISISNVDKDHEIVFIYKDDKNNNGIPDDEENYAIAEKYQKPDGSMIKNDSNTYIKLGDTYTKVAPKIKNYIAIDIKLDKISLGKKDVKISNISEDHEVIFIYKEDLNNNGIPDDEESYTVVEKYQKTDGAFIQDNTTSYVKVGEVYTKVAPVIKNYVFSDVKLDGVLIGKKSIVISNMDKNHEIVFIYKNDKNNNGVPDDEENYTITEKYQKLDGSQLQTDAKTILRSGEDYFKNAPSINNYVVYQIKLDGNTKKDLIVSISNIYENHEIVFIYKDDKNNNGIPDDEESYTITEKYQKNNGVSLSIDTITSIKGTQNYSKAAIKIDKFVAIDIKLDGQLTGKTDIKISNVLEQHEVIFIYDDDKNNNGIPDSKENYTILEKYKKLDGTNLKQDISLSIKGGENYSKIAPKIPSYDLEYIKIDGVSINSTTALINNLDKNHEVIFFYKEVKVAKPVIDPITPKDEKITGIGTPGYKIEVTFQNGSKQSATVDKNGIFSVNVPNNVNLVPENQVSAQEIDKNGNVSDKSIGKVLPYPIEPKILEPIKPNDVKINGQGETNKDIVVIFPDGSSQKSSIKTNGDWEIDVPENISLASGDVIKAYVMDKNGNKSKEVTSKIINMSKPTPTINTIISGDKIISGKGTSGNTIFITLPNGSQLKDIVVDNSGKWSTTINITLKPGDILKIIEKNKDGVSSDEILAKVSDLPKPPSIDPSINPKTTSISGEGSANQQIVMTFADGKEVKESIGANGKWIINVPRGTVLKSGDLIKAYVMDKNGNKSLVSTAKVSKGEVPVLEVTSSKIVDFNSSFNVKSLITKARDNEDGQNLIDKVVINGLVDTSKIGGYSIEYSLTDNDGNEVKAKSVVSVKGKNTIIIGDVAIDAQSFNILSKFVPTLTNSDILENSKAYAWNITTSDNLTSRIEIDKTKLKTIEGNFPVSLRVNLLKTVKGKDSAGNDAAVIYVQVFEQVAPIIDTPVRTTHMYISGTSDLAKKVTVTFPNGSKKEVLVGDNGKWIVAIPKEIKLNPKDQIKAYAQNEKGNKSQEVLVKVSDQKAQMPTVNTISLGDKTISGKGVSGNKIEITFQDGTKAEGLIKSDGNWSIVVPDKISLKQGNVIKVVEKDKNSNDGNEISVEVGKCYTNLNITRPVKANDKVVKGIGTPGNKVIITFRNGNTSSSTIDKNGIWSVNIPNSINLSANDKITAHEEDAKGNISDDDIALVSAEFTLLPGEL